MREEKPYLTFTISNSPLITVAKDEKDNDLILGHEHWDYPAGEHVQELQEWISRYGIYKITGPFPKEPRLYVGKYYGEDNLEIYRTRKRYRPNPKFPHRFTAAVVEFTGYLAPTISKSHPESSFTSLDEEIFYGSPITEDPWPVFNKLAWFQDLYSAIPSRSNEINQKEILSFIDFALFYGTTENMLDHFQEEIASCFKIVSYHPEVLNNLDVRRQFIDYLRCARHGGKKESTKMRKIFHDNFRLDKKKSYSLISLYEALITKLAVHLKGICKKNDSGISTKGTNSGGCRTVDVVGLKKWAHKNKEARIAALPNKNLTDLLLLKTEKYANTRLAEIKAFGESPKTWQRERARLSRHNNHKKRGQVF